MIYKIEGYMRPVNALGTQVWTVLVIDAPTPFAAIVEAYKMHEHFDSGVEIRHDGEALGMPVHDVNENTTDDMIDSYWSEFYDGEDEGDDWDDGSWQDDWSDPDEGDEP